MRTLGSIGLATALASTPCWAQSPTELKKDLFPKVKKAQAEGKDLGEAKTEYDEGDKALKAGEMDEAVEHFKKAKELMPKDP